MRPRLLALALAFLAPLATAQTPRDRLAERCQQALDELRGRAGFPGGSAALILRDGTELTFTTGVTSAAAEGRSLRPGDRMLAGSVGKTFVAAAALHLAHRGELSLDDRAAEHLGDHAWFARVPNASELTLRQLLRHQSGLPRYELKRAFWKALLDQPDKAWQPEELLAYVLDAPPLFAPGGGFAYSDTDYVVVGMVLEKVAGVPFYDYVRRHLLAPHRLTDTVPSDRRAIDGLVQGESRLFRQLGLSGPVLEDGAFVINPQFEWCGGGFASTPLDLARWARILWTGKAFDGDYLEAALDGVPADALGPGTRYGIGVIVRDTEAGRLLGHDGVFPGYLTTMGWFPGRGVAAAFQVNSDDQRALGQPMHALLVELARFAAGETQGDK